MIKPKRPTTAKHAKRPKHIATPMGTPLARSFAQKLRVDRVESYATPLARANYWAQKMKKLQEEQVAQMDQSISSLGSGLASHASAFGPIQLGADAGQNSPAPLPVSPLLPPNK